MDIPDKSNLDSYLAYFHARCHANTKWFGRLTMKTPFDAWVFQEIIWDTRPDVIIEVGNLYGGSALFTACVLDFIGKGLVVGIDKDDKKRRDIVHPRIRWITGDATDKLVIEKIKTLISPEQKVMVIEDSSHTYENTLAVLNGYSDLVTSGCYFIVEDGICKEEYIPQGPKPGPYEAIHAFLKSNNHFEIDKEREKFLLTYNPDGYLRKT